MTDMTAKKRAQLIISGDWREYPYPNYELEQQINAQICEAEAAAAKTARDEFLQIPHDSVEDIEAYLNSGRPLTGLTKAVFECGRRKALEDMIAIIRERLMENTND